MKIQNTRKNFVHRFIDEKDLFPDLNVADEAIAVVREAIKGIYSLSGKTSPIWVDDDYDRGWSKKSGFQMRAYLTKRHAGVDENDEHNIKVAFVDNHGEHVSDILPPEIDYQLCIDELINNSLEPISAIRIYKGKELIEERKYTMRGI